MSKVTVALRLDDTLDVSRFHHLMRETGFRQVHGLPGQFSLILDTDAGPDQVAQMTRTTVQHFAEVAGAEETDQLVEIKSVDPA